MPLDAEPYAEKKFLEIEGYRMAYLDEGKGDAIVFQHGNPTSSYLWRNVMPYCAGLGRLIACDLIGMGDSDKLSDSGPDRYSFTEHQRFLDALWDKLDLGNRVILVLHDWGSALGFDWANRHRDRVQGIAYMESIVRTGGSTLSAEAARAARAIFTEQGMLVENAFVEKRLPASIQRTLSSQEMNEYRRPFRNPGEDRRPTLSWPLQLMNADKSGVAGIVAAYGAWLADSDVPKLFVNAEPGVLTTGQAREFCRTWPNQTEVTVQGLHFIQEDSPDEIGEALRTFVSTLRAP